MVTWATIASKISNGSFMFQKNQKDWGCQRPRPHPRKRLRNRILYLYVRLRPQISSQSTATTNVFYPLRVYLMRLLAIKDISLVPLASRSHCRGKLLRTRKANFVDILLLRTMTEKRGRKISKRTLSFSKLSDRFGIAIYFKLSFLMVTFPTSNYRTLRGFRNKKPPIGLGRRTSDPYTPSQEKQESVRISPMPTKL